MNNLPNVSNLDLSTILQLYQSNLIKQGYIKDKNLDTENRYKNLKYLSNPLCNNLKRTDYY